MPLSEAGFATEYRQETDARWENAKISVMVLGPSTESTKLPAQLRGFIIKQCQEHGVVITGEHRHLRSVYERIVGSGKNLCSHEYGLAKKVDALVIIPASAGSLVELGLFALVEDICRKSLVLFNEKYSDTANPTFIHVGPKLSYENKGATIKFVNYRQRRAIWPIIDDFLRNLRALKYDRLLLKDTS